MTYARSWFLLTRASAHARSLNRTLSTSLKIFIVIWIGLFPRLSLACTCFGSSLERTYSVSDAVIEARMIPNSMRGKEVRVYSELYDRELTFLENRSVLLSITKVWKGEAVESVNMYDPSNTTCGFNFEEDQTYIIFADFLRPTDSGTDEQSRASKRKISPGSTTYFPISPSEDQDSTQEDSAVDVEAQGKPLFTHYCMENVRVPEDRSSEQIKTKLHRLQKDAKNAPTRSEFTEPLRLRIREIVESSNQLTVSPY